MDRRHCLAYCATNAASSEIPSVPPSPPPQPTSWPPCHRRLRSSTAPRPLRARRVLPLPERAASSTPECAAPSPPEHAAGIVSHRPSRDPSPLRSLPPPPRAPRWSPPPSPLNAPVVPSAEQSSPVGSPRASDFSTKQARRGRTSSKRPSGRYVITEVDPQSGGPVAPEESCKKWRTICGIVAREKVKITVVDWKKLTGTHRDSIAKEILRSFHVPEGTEDGMRRAALMGAAKAWRNFKCALVKEFIKKDLTPFERYPFVTTNDWEQFVAMKTSDGFLEKSEKNRALCKRNKHHHRLGTSGYAGHKKIWSKEDEEAERCGQQPVFSSITDDRARDWCRGRVTYDAQGKPVWQNPADEEVYNKMLELSSQSSQGSIIMSHRLDDLLTKGLGTKEHPGRTRGKGVLVPWGKAFPDEDEDARQSRKRTKTERMKAAIREELREEMDAQIRREVADIEASLRAQHTEEGVGGVVQASPDALGSSCASRGPEASLSCTYPADLLQNPAPCKLHVRLSTADYSLEAGLGVVYPPVEGQVTHGVVLAPGFVRVHLYHVHEYIKECPLPNIRPDDDMKVLSDAIGSYIQWPKRDIVLDSPPVASTTLPQRKES